MTPNGRRQRRAGTTLAKQNHADRRGRCTPRLGLASLSSLIACSIHFSAQHDYEDGERKRQTSDGIPKHLGDGVLSAFHPICSSALEGGDTASSNKHPRKVARKGQHKRYEKGHEKGPYQH